MTGGYIYDAGGRHVATIGVIRDRTPEVQAAEDREELRRRATQNQRLESMRLLAAGVAHEFNNLLSATLTNAAYASEAIQQGDPDAEEALDDIVVAARRAGSLCQQMLAFTGEQHVSFEDTDLRRLVADTATLFSRSLGENVDLETDLAADVPRVRADPPRLQEALTQVLRNAAESYGAARGEVFVRLSEVVITAGALTGASTEDALSPGRWLAIDVADRGQGIAAESRSGCSSPSSRPGSRAGARARVRARAVRHRAPSGSSPSATGPGADPAPARVARIARPYGWLARVDGTGRVMEPDYLASPGPPSCWRAVAPRSRRGARRRGGAGADTAGRVVALRRRPPHPAASTVILISVDGSVDYAERADPHPGPAGGRGRPGRRAGARLPHQDLQLHPGDRVVARPPRHHRQPILRTRPPRVLRRSARGTTPTSGGWRRAHLDHGGAPGCGPTMFWVGSEVQWSRDPADLGGALRRLRALRRRVDRVLHWLDQPRTPPASSRSTSTSRTRGPRPWTGGSEARAVETVDAMLGRLVAGLEAQVPRRDGPRGGQRPRHDGHLLGPTPLRRRPHRPRRGPGAVLGRVDEPLAGGRRRSGPGGRPAPGPAPRVLRPPRGPARSPPLRHRRAHRAGPLRGRAGLHPHQPRLRGGKPRPGARRDPWLQPR